VRELRGYVLLLLGGGSARVLSFATAVVVARVVDPTEFGRYSLYVAVLIALATGTVFVDWTYVRFASADAGRERDYLRASFFLKLALLAGFVSAGYPVAFVLARYALHDRGLTTALYAAIVGGVLLTFPSLLAAVHQAGERFGRFARLTTVFYAAVFALVLALWATGSLTIRAVFVAYSVSALAVAVPCIARLGALTRPWRIDRVVIRQLASFSKWLAASNLTDVLGQRLDIIFLGAYASLGDVGQYGAALRILGIASLLTGVLPTLLLGRASQTRDSIVAMRQYLASTRRLSAGLAVVIGGLWLATPLIVRVALGGSYAAAAGLTRIMLLGVAFGAVYAPLAQLFLAENDPRRVAYFSVVRLVSLVVLLATLVPVLGAKGAAWSFAGSEFAALACTLVLVLPTLRRIREPGVVRG
jgi:O-antigen/teichoic acid export membrane protein